MTARQVMTVKMKDLQAGDYSEWVGGCVEGGPRGTVMVNGNGEYSVCFDNGVTIRWTDRDKEIEIERPYPNVTVSHEDWAVFTNALADVSRVDMPPGVADKIWRYIDAGRELVKAVEGP